MFWTMAVCSGRFSWSCAFVSINPVCVKPYLHQNATQLQGCGHALQIYPCQWKRWLLPTAGVSVPMLKLSPKPGKQPSSLCRCSPSHRSQKLQGHFKFSHWHTLAGFARSSLGNAHEKYFAGRARWLAARCGNFFHQHRQIRNRTFICILSYCVTKLYNRLLWTQLYWYKHTYANIVHS